MTSTTEIIQNLVNETQESNCKENIQAYEDMIVEKIDEAVEISEFSHLPVTNFLSILSKINFANHNINILDEAIRKMIDIHGDDPEILQLLHKIKKEDFPNLNLTDLHHWMLHKQQNMCISQLDQPYS